jgi:hypothetical protein
MPLGSEQLCFRKPYEGRPFGAHFLSGTPASAQRLAFSCEVLRERSDRGPRQLQRPSWTAAHVPCTREPRALTSAEWIDFLGAARRSHSTRPRAKTRARASGAPKRRNHPTQHETRARTFRSSPTSRTTWLMNALPRCRERLSPQPARLHPVGTTRSSTRATGEPPRAVQAPTTRCRRQPGSASTGDNFHANLSPKRITSQATPVSWAGARVALHARGLHGTNTCQAPRRSRRRTLRTDPARNALPPGDNLGTSFRTPTSHRQRPGEERTPLSWNHTPEPRPGRAVACSPLGTTSPPKRLS